MVEKAASTSWPTSDGHLFGVVDVELTNRCNAHCSFCPRDVTPHQGVMAPEVFEQVLHRVLEFREASQPVLQKAPTVSFCGLGEQLLNSSVASFVGDLRSAGIDSVVNTNASLLDEHRGQALIEAGVGTVVINGGEVEAQYEATYQLPFDRTRDNVARFVQLAGDRCRVFVVLVDHGGDPEHVRTVEQFWRELGVYRFFRLDLLNRAGSLPVTSMEYGDDTRPARADELWHTVSNRSVCDAPFHFPFIGYDGQYYLCSSDWQKEVAFGNVFDVSIVDIMAAKLRTVTSRSPICRSCNHDPLNRLADGVAAVDQGRARASDLVGLARHLGERSANQAQALAKLGVQIPSPTRALIPVRAR